MGKYVALPGNPSGSETPRIAMEEDSGAFVTVLSRAVHDSRFPLDSASLLQNFAALLNGNPPLHHLHADDQIFYQRLSSGVALHFRKADRGVSEIGFLLTVPGHDRSQTLGAEALSRIDPTFMKILCDAIDMSGSGQTPESAARANPQMRV